VFINAAVCEGCGDCSVQSNCLSVEPLETDLGRKRQINHSSCNKDYSCVSGFCPSFVTVEGGNLRKPSSALRASNTAVLPSPLIPGAAQPYGILVTGVGGTGVVTVGQIIAMAAHLEGKGCTVLDMAGLAQKGGAVMSHVRVADNQSDLHSTRVSTGAADLVIGCDLIVTASRDALSRMGDGRTYAAINDTTSPTAAFIKDPNWQVPTGSAHGDIRAACGAQHVDFIDAGTIATALLGDGIATNMFMLGFAWQKGRVPLSEAALTRAIELNGVAVTFNQQAFTWGRRAAHNLVEVEKAAQPAVVEHIRAPTLNELIENRVERLSAYQNEAYARQYRDFVETIRTAEAKLGDSSELTTAVARYLYKLMAYKDEYEVARLYTDGEFAKKIAANFEGDVKLKFHLAPPLLAKRDASGHLIKQEFGGWTMAAFRLLARLKFLRGTALDIFGYTAERKQERELIGSYRNTITDLLAKLNRDNFAAAVKIASIPEEIRGYGHVKERHIAAALRKEAELRATF
jgi:indolepyruvate ferredoxin oxidoreductase